MYQTLFFIRNEIGGIPVFGVGWLLGVWALGSVVLLLWLGRRQGFNADTWSYVPLLALVAAVIWFLLPALVQEPDPESDRPGGLPIRGYGVMLLIAVVSATALAAWRAHRTGRDPDMVFSLAFWMFVPGIIAARMFHVVEYWQETYWPVCREEGFAALLGAMVNVAKGGLVVYGGFLGGVLGLLLFVRRYRLPLLAVCDLIAPSLMLGLALGRVGCLLNGCCFGQVCCFGDTCDLPWAVTFPRGSPPYQSQVERGQMYGFRLSGDPKAEPVLLAVDQHSEAGKKGLQREDRVKRISGIDCEISSTGQLHRALRERFRDEKPVVIEVDGRPPVTLPAIKPHPVRSLRVHPTQIYSLTGALLLCLLLLAYDPFRRRDGELFALMISLYPITRYLLEDLRTDESPVFSTGLSISQNVSLLMLACAAALWFYVLRQPRGTSFGQQD